MRGGIQTKNKVLAVWRAGRPDTPRTCFESHLGHDLHGIGRWGIPALLRGTLRTAGLVDYTREDFLPNKNNVADDDPEDLRTLQAIAITARTGLTVVRYDPSQSSIPPDQMRDGLLEGYRTLVHGAREVIADATKERLGSRHEQARAEHMGALYAPLLGNTSLHEACENLYLATLSVSDR
jgi:hypothetical protein